MAGLKQADRLMQFSSPLGRDVLVIESLDGSEGISRLFEYHAELFATIDTTIDPKALIGAKVSVALALSDVAGSRWVNGIVASFEQSSGDVEFDVYHARIVPSAWQLTLASNCRVFQNLTVMDIVKKVIGEYGLSLSDQTTAAYKPLDYCTQYNESDFHFIARILQQHGVFFWFEHTEQDNKIVFGDSRSAYADCPLSASFAYEPGDSGREGTYSATVTEFTATATMVSGKHSTRDYDFRPYAYHDVPAKSSTSPYGNNAYEGFLYPAGEEGYVKLTGKELSSPNHGAIFLEAETQSSDAMAEIFRGISNARSMTAGFTFSLSKHPRSAWSRKYLLTEMAMHTSQAPTYRTTGSGGSSSSGYSNRFTAVSSDIVYRSPLTLQKPRIFGPQTALVVGPAGEEIYLDKLGRVCVQFFWDRTRQPNTIDNTWVRVAQPWAGHGWGTFFWPRVKDEVVVQFLEGDPDNPVVIGSVYNGVNVPKYPLPDNSTRTGMVTRSSKGGSAANANELRFEDKQGSEQIFLNAEMDMDHRTEKDHRRWVGGQDSLSVTGAQYEAVGGDRHGNVTGNTVDKIGSNADIDIGSNLNEKVGSNYSLQVGQNHAEQVGQNYGLNAGMEIYLKAGMTLVIESGMELCLKAGGNFITIGPAGIAISGVMVMINSGGAPVSGSPGSLQSPGAPKPPDIADDGSTGGKM
jgi:type VI secretion system secreted protein VgrG